MAENSSSAPRPRRSIVATRDPEQLHRVVRRSRYRRGFAYLMMALMGLSSAGLAGVFFYRATTAEDQQVSHNYASPEVAVSNKSVKMMAPKVTGFDRKSQAYEINAKVARQDQDEPHIVHMEEIIAHLKLKKSNDLVQVTSKTGTYDNQAETLELVGDIVVVSTNGYTAWLERADVALREGRITTDRPVTIDAPGATIAANAMEMSDHGDTFRFFNRARMRVKGEKSKQKDSG